MKICFITGDLATIGGVQRVLSVLANGLADKHEVSIIMTSKRDVSNKVCFSLNENISIVREDKLSSGKTEYLLHKAFRFINKKIIKIHSISILKWAYFPRKEIEEFSNYLKEHSFDVVIGVQPRASALVANLSGDFTKIGWMHSTYDAYFRSPMRFQWRQEDLYKELLPKLDKLIVLTDHDKERFGREMAEMSIERVYNPLSFTSSNKVKTEKEIKKVRLLFVGRMLWETKGLDLMLEILSHLKRMKVSFVLQIVGDGPDRERFIKEAENLGVASDIELCGMQKDVLPYYLQNDILILPSRWEGFGLVVTEALECGLPVISFKTEGPVEILNRGLSDCLIEKFDTENFAKKIQELASNGIYRTEISCEASVRAKDFSLETIIARWNDILLDGRISKQ